MKIYKARAIVDVVVQAETADEAVRAVENLCDIKGTPVNIERFTQIHRLEDLPKGWTGKEQAFSEKPVLPPFQHSIRYWLETEGVE